MVRLTTFALIAALACDTGLAAMRRTDHPSGFAITHPDGWAVEAVDGMARAVAPDGSEFVAVGPLAVRPGQSAADVLRALVAGGAVGPIRSPRLVALRDEGDTTRGLLAVGDRRAQAMVVLRGGAGTLYLAGAPADRFETRLPTLVDLLRSVSLGRSQPAAPPIQFVRLTEPRERAYSVDLPAGWGTDLGVHRVGALTPRFETSAVAPDRGATLFVGDRNAGTFTVPTPVLAQTGLREGMVYDPTGVHPSMLLRYLPGDAYARHWLAQRLPGARVIDARPLPELANRLAAERYRFGNALNGRIHAGELDFEHQGQRGRVTVATELTLPGGDSQLWSPILLAGWFARPDRTPLAAAALARAVGSLQIELAWMRTDRAFARLDHQRALATQQSINALFRQTMVERAESSARNARGIGDTLAGTYRVIDPNTREVTTVQAGSNFYYRIDRTDTVIGSQQELAPVDLTRMLRLDWDTRR